jgi:HK97 family phage portal protein
MLGFFSRSRGQVALAERQEPQLMAPKAEGQAPRPLPDWSAAELFSGIPSLAGPVVTAETAMRVAAVYACVRLIAGAIAGLPLHVFKQESDDRVRARNHPLDWLLNHAPNSLMTAAVWLEYVVTSILLAGDSFNLIVWTAGGQALEIIPLDPGTVHVQRRGNLWIYTVLLPDGRWIAVDQGDILHIPGVGFSLTTGRSKSVIAHAARQGIGIAIAAEDYSARFFANGVRPDVVLKYPSKLTTEQVQQLKDFWVKKHSGLANAHAPAVLTEGGEIETLSLSAEDAQLLEARKFQVIDIARAFGVPPVMIGESEKNSSWGTGIESQGIGFRTYCLRQHGTKIEQEVNRKLLGSGRFFVEFNYDGLLQADSTARGNYFRQALGGSSGPGWMTQNDVRRKENLPRIDDPAADRLSTGTKPEDPKPSEGKDDDAQEQPAGGNPPPADEPGTGTEG